MVVKASKTQGAEAMQTFANQEGVNLFKATVKTEKGEEAWRYFPTLTEAQCWLEVIAEDGHLPPSDPSTF